MEIDKAILKLRGSLRAAYMTMIVLFMLMNGYGQQVYTVKDGRMYIELNKQLPASALDSFIRRYDLGDLAIKYFIRTNSTDSLKYMGWRIDKNERDVFAISKALISAEDLTNIADKIIFTDKGGVEAMFPAVNNGLTYGYNRFQNKSSFATHDSIVTFYLRANLNAGKVTLAGSFNKWDPDNMPMTKTDSGWIAQVKLVPGKYWYKFIIDGNWTQDDDNRQKENDGYGNTNSVYYKTNHVFKLNGYTEAKRVYLAGSFNRWQPKDLLMQRTATGWELPLYLAEGTHTYKYVIDGDWKVDPGNPDRFRNEFDDYNSVVSFGKPYLFKLKGYENAKKVLLTGTFNGWRKDELYMTRTDSGWVLPYTIGPGNYEYRFIVDKKEIVDPDNPFLTSEKRSEANSFLILGANYTFRLKGYPDAKKVFLSGDFNNFNPSSLAMKHVGNEWIFSVHLTTGKHIYKFVVDNKWIRDPSNELWEQNSFGTGDSVLWYVGE